MKITDLKCAVIGSNPVVRINTDEGLYGLGEVEASKSYLKPHVLFYKDFILGQDPTDVERVMLNIRRLGSFKPWGSAVSAIEMALWDIAGKAVGAPVYKAARRQNPRPSTGVQWRGAFPHGGRPLARRLRSQHAAHEGRAAEVQHHQAGPRLPRRADHRVARTFYGHPPSRSVPRNRGPLSERGLNYTVDCIRAMKEVCGDEVGLALDLGPGFLVPDALRLARAVEDLNVAWLEDMLTGDYVPYVSADHYREVTQSTSTPIHTGEQIYLRHNFQDLIEKRAVDIIGPDPCDIGGIAELKWVAEYADLHGILMAPHGTGDGLLGLAALVQVAATLPQNYLAFEYPTGQPEWWYDIVEGLPDPIVVDSHIAVWDAPGMGVDLIAEEARRYLREEDADFFDQ